MLQAQYTNARFSFMESGKLVRAQGELLCTLQELEKTMRILGLVDNNTIDLTREDDQFKRMKAKVWKYSLSRCSSQSHNQVQILLAHWMNESDRYEASYMLKQFQNAANSAPGWESAFYHLGHFQDWCYRNLSADDKSSW
jgi:serine/threonine-protein kinase ATR